MQMVAIPTERQVNIIVTVVTQLNRIRPSQLKNLKSSLREYRRQSHVLFRLAATLAPAGELIRLPKVAGRTIVAASSSSLAVAETKR